MDSGFWEIAIMIASVVLSLERVKAWRAKNKETALGVAMEALETGVHAIYPMVREWKKQNGSSKLTASQRDRARELAKKRAREYAKDNKVDLDKVLHPDRIDAIIEKTVIESKISQNKETGNE